MQEHERERPQRDHEREAHRPYWDQPVRVSPSCSAYGTMEYKAQLWDVPLGSDWYQASVHRDGATTHGRTLEKPDRCEDLVSVGAFFLGMLRGSGMESGYWRVEFDEPECMTS